MDEGKQVLAMRARSHFRRRALERHGLELDGTFIKRLRERLYNHEGEFLKWGDGGYFRSFYRISIYGQKYIVLFDFELEEFVTILHGSWLKWNGSEWVDHTRTTKKKRLWLNYLDRMKRKQEKLK